nr:energy coupling factor transporter S component ThiW [uncultured Agathobaculum sp.]
MKKTSIRKLTLAGLLVAVAVVGSLFSIPVLGSKCSPVQHMVNVLAGVLLGPWYACGMGFAAALLRNLLGLGSLLAFPGSMIGALLCGLLYKLWPKLPVAYVGEVFGTGILGGMASYPIAAVLMNNSAAALFTFVPSFLVSTAVGAAISVIVLAALRRTHVFSQLEGALR